MSRWRDEAQVFLLAVQFLTRLPVPSDLPFSNDRLIRATRYYPLVGLIVGAIGALVLVLTAWVLPWSVAVPLSMAATILATGAFHEDGLADAADGLGGGLTRERALEIMRDSRIGTYGAVTLGLVLAIKAAVLMSFDFETAVWALVLMHGISRLAPVIMVSHDNYAREVGAKFVAPTVSQGGLQFALVSSTGMAVTGGIVFGAVPILSAFLTASVVAVIYRRMILRKLQGYTGDCLGGLQQLTELGLYLGLAIWL